jgi:hypothetical protein
MLETMAPRHHRDHSKIQAGWLAAAMALAVAGCVDASVTFSVAREVAFTASDFPLMAEFQEFTAQGTIVRSVPCESTATCPMTAEINVECNTDGLCDPVATRGTAHIQDVDLTEVTERLSVVDSLALRRVEFAVLTNTLNVDLPAAEVYWAPVGTASVDDAVRFGSLPAIRAGETPMSEVSLDAAGTAALNDHLEGVAPQFRLFLETAIDIEPGAVFPQGAFTANVQFQVRATGRVR